MTEQTPEQKELAVLVAKDVLQTMEDNPKNFAIESGHYYFKYSGSVGLESIVESDKWYKLPSQEQANIAKKKCSVCALGACFLSLVSLKNRFIFESRILGRSSIANRLSEIFSFEQMELIESAFEQALMIDNSWENCTSSHTKALENAVNFGRNYRNPRKRLVAILKNIIQNNGIFDPTILPT